MMLSQLILTLLAGGLLAWLSERRGAAWPRQVALLTLLAALVELAWLCGSLPWPDGAALVASEPASWLVHETHAWIPRFGIRFALAMDGLSLALLALTLALGMVAVVASWSEVRARPGFFHANLLWTLAGALGVFLAVDLFLFFVCWEVMLVPMYLLIAIWGHEQRARAAMKFFLFTQAGGLLMLVAIVVCALDYCARSGHWSFGYFDWLRSPMSGAMSAWVLAGFLAAFLVKLPAFPLHSWLPDAHTQAPTAGSVILAGVLLKTGAYGMLRFGVALFPQAAREVAPLMMGLGVAGVLYGAVLAFAQTDFKRLVAYSSVSHMGFVLLGLFAWNALAWSGAVMQLVAHGLSTAALFTIAGALQERLHSRDMRAMGGLWAALPRIGATAMLFAIASLGMPGLGNFIAEFMVLAGAFQVAPWLCAAATLSLVTGALYALSMLQQTFHGPLQAGPPYPDFGARELFAMGALALGLLWLGLYPQPLLDLTAPVLAAIDAHALELRP